MILVVFFFFLGGGGPNIYIKNKKNQFVARYLRKLYYVVIVTICCCVFLCLEVQINAERWLVTTFSKEIRISDSGGRLVVLCFLKSSNDYGVFFWQF